MWIWLTVPGARELLAAHPAHRTGARRVHLRARSTGSTAAADAAPRELAEPLNERELTVLRFLPTNLVGGRDRQRAVPVRHTVKTHMRKLYAKLDVHTRAEAVERGRALGLLAPARARVSFTRIV